MREKPVKKERTEDGSHHCSQSERGDAHALDQQQTAHNGAESVDESYKGLHAELLAYNQDRAKDSARQETQLRGQENAREMHAESSLLRIETVHQQVNQPGRQDLGDAEWPFPAPGTWWRG